MKAWTVREYGAYRDVLRIEDVPLPDCPPRHARVRVKTAGLNFPDILIIAGKYQERPPLPFTPGIEGAGVVEEVNGDSELAVGDRVIVGLTRGTFAETVCIPTSRLFRIPDGMSDAEAAGFLVTYQTSHVALLERARMQAGEWLLVHGGAGGVGSSAIQIGKAKGARVIATAGSEEKLAVCRTLGADTVINYREDDFVARVKEVTEGHGADVIYDPVGGDVFDKSSKCIAWAGRLLVIGFASGRIPEIAANRLLLKNMAAMGVYWGAYFDRDPNVIQNAHDDLCKMYVNGQTRPLVHREFPFDELPAALEEIQSRRAIGKVVLRVSA